MTYQVSVRELSERTSIDFGDAVTKAGELRQGIRASGALESTDHIEW